MKPTDLSQMKEETQKALGSEYEELKSAGLVKIHSEFNKAYNNFNDVRAEALKNMITLAMMYKL